MFHEVVKYVWMHDACGVERVRACSRDLLADPHGHLIGTLAATQAQHDNFPHRQLEIDMRLMPCGSARPELNFHDYVLLDLYPMASHRPPASAHARLKSVQRIIGPSTMLQPCHSCADTFALLEV